MSRIHDALKKAEQEKAAGHLSGGAASPGKAGPPGWLQPEGLSSREGGGLRKPSRPVREDPVRATLLKALDERCRRSSWIPQTSMTLFVHGKKHSPGAEEFRSFRSQLYLVRIQQPVRRLLITSALPEEGKSFTAVNLSFVMAQQPDCRVLLIDADLRMAELHQILGAPPTPGLSDYLAGGVDEFSVVQRGPVPNLYLIPSGKTVSNPSELIGNGRFKLLLDRLAPAFDWVILDSPPVIPVSDAKLLAGLCDGTLMVVKAGKTPFDLAQKACQEFRDKGLLGVVLNQVRVDSKYGYYYGQSERKSKK